MFKNKIVCTIKHNNTPMAENKDTVFLPYNTQYSIYLKNMADTTAYISVFVNGRDINPGQKVKLEPKCSATIEKFQDTNHTFVFKKRTLALQDVRTNQDEDALIRLEVSFQVKEYKNKGFDFLKDLPQRNNKPFIPPPGVVPMYPDPMTPYCGGKTNINGNFYGMEIDGVLANKQESFSTKANSIAADTHCSYSGGLADSVLSDIYSTGFTATGKKKEEKDDVVFYNGCTYEVDEEFTFIIKLEKSEKPIANKDIKKTCPDCNKKFKYTYFYCPYDGTYLEE